ncbi:hypothetical protein DYB32_009016, partial [Aphanomyces invadans]
MSTCFHRLRGNWKQIYWNDVYHTVINVKTRSLILGVVVAYVLVTLFFAVMYLVVSYNDEKCNVGIKTLAEAYIFSIETIMTIGYGAPTNDIFYGSCGSMALLLTLELVEAHIRCYAVRDEIDANGDETVFQTHSMRLQQPDDDLGSYLLMAMPQLVVHRIDQWSPLYPPECRPQGAHYNATTNQAYPDPLQRAVDHDNGNRDYDPDVSLPQSPTREAIERHFARTNMEIVVILEGEDSTTSNTAQARHSYRLSDIVWDHMFARC